MRTLADLVRVEAHVSTLCPTRELVLGEHEDTVHVGVRARLGPRYGSDDDDREDVRLALTAVAQSLDRTALWFANMIR